VGGVVIAEQIFSMPGLGKTAVTAITQQLSDLLAAQSQAARPRHEQQPRHRHGVVLAVARE